MHIAPLVQDLAIILLMGGFVALLFSRIKQPLVLGYILAGFLTGPYMPWLPTIHDLPSVRIWADIGVIFLMFSLGLEFSFRKLTKVGVSAGLTALIEVSFNFLIGYLVAQIMGWSFVESLFLGGLLCISSTSIILRTTEELKIKTRRFAQLIFAILVVEDLLAILILVLLTMAATASNLSILSVTISAGKLVLVVGTWFLTGYFLLPRFMRYVGKFGTEEMITIFSLGLCLGLAVLAAHFQYSVALGAFIMGSILAESTESHRIEEMLVPLKNVFAAVFFISIGMLIDPKILFENWQIILLTSSLVVFGKICFVTAGSVLTGQTLRTATQVGFGLAQIGEFSFIIAGLASASGVPLGDRLFVIAVGTSLVTTFLTPYFIKHSNSVAVFLEKKLPFRLKNGLTRYAAWVEEKRLILGQRTEFYGYFGRWILSGFSVTVVFALCSELLRPFLKGILSERLPDQYVGSGSTTLTWALAFLSCAPFIWSMFASFPRKKVNSVSTVFHLLTIFFLAILTALFFPSKYTIALSVLTIIFFLILFYKQLEASYKWIEKEFLSTFEDVPKSKRPKDLTRHLAPWDAHLVRLKVHPNSRLVGLPLQDSKLRSEFGLNIVVIQRGLKSIVAPKPKEIIFPKDELLVLGTDEQIEFVRPAIEKPPGLENRFEHLSSYEMKSIIVTENSKMISETIRSSGIREKFNCMVVGIERDGKRILNPDSDLKIQEKDLLWLVGDNESITKLKEKLG
ncbi:MAG: cation:proton antiporter [Bacteriovoracia bacterium]